jgi:AraC-like DNA-binding protein
MVSNATDFAPIRFLARALPGRDRLPMQRNAFGRRTVRDDIEPPADGSPLRDQSMTLFINVGRKAVISFRGREAVLGRHDAVLVGTDPGAVATSGRYLGVLVPREVLASRVDDLDGAFMRPIRRGNVALRLLTSYLRGLSGCDLTAPPQLQQSVEMHIQDLAALAIGVPGPAPKESLRVAAAARLCAAQAHIAKCFDRPELTVASVAGRLGVSPRYLQRLFETQGTSFTAHVNELRLQRALALLTAAPSRRRRIADIALEAGFSDISHFNRLFRSRFGDTPRGVRAAGRSIDAVPCADRNAVSRHA